MNARDRVLLRHMLDEARTAQQFTQGRSPDDMESDRQLSYALRYALQIIGEAASQITAETRAALPDIHWKNIIGMRHRLVHGYEQVRSDIVWNTVSYDLTPLIEKLTVLAETFPPEAE